MWTGKVKLPYTWISPNSIMGTAQQKWNSSFPFYHDIVCCVYSLESSRRGDSYVYTQLTIIV